MLIDKHTIKIIGSRYDHKKDKQMKDQVIANYDSIESMDLKKLSYLIQEIADSHDAHQETEVSITLKQHQYD